MQSIIVTKKAAEGENLQTWLAKFDGSLASVPYYTKEDVIRKASELNDCRYIFSTWYMPEFTVEEITELFPSLECIFYAAGTVKYFAEPFLKRGVRVFSASKANGIPVAEFAAAQIILANKGYFQAQRTYRWPAWHKRFNASRGYAERKSGNYDANVGIIGCGAIGSKIIELLSSYNLNIYICDPYITDEQASFLGVKQVSMDELFEICDVISNHLPDIPETRGIIGDSLLNRMKPTATFINTGRGAQVDEKALNKVLKRHKDMCALLDVTSHEPLLPWSPLYTRKNVFLTPHIAGSLSGEYGRMVEYMVAAYRDVVAGKPSPCETSLDIISKQSTH